MKDPETGKYHRQCHCAEPLFLHLEFLYITPFSPDIISVCVAYAEIVCPAFFEFLYFDFQFRFVDRRILADYLGFDIIHKVLVRSVLDLYILDVLPEVLILDLLFDN